MAEEEGLPPPIFWHNVTCPFRGPSRCLVGSPALAPFSRPHVFAKVAIPSHAASSCEGGWWAWGSCLGSKWGCSGGSLGCVRGQVTPSTTRRSRRCTGSLPAGPGTCSRG